MLLTAAEKHRCVNMVNVKELASPSIRWFVEEIAHLSPAEWSRCVNMLCGIYGCDIVLEVAKKYCRDFFERYIPDKSLFFHEQRVTVRNLAVICFRRNGGGAERATGIWMQKVQKLGIKCIWMPDRTWEKDSEFALDEDPVKREAELERYIKSEKIDAVLLVDHWRYTCFQDLLIAKRLGCKTIIAEHSTYFFPLDDLNPSLFLAREHFYPIADVITVLSPENVAWWNARGLKNVVYMPNFLTFEKRSSLRKWRNKSYELLCVGRICKRKGAELILEALSVFLQNHKDLESKVKLTFLGRFEDDEMQERMKTMRHRLSLDECVDFAGNVDNVSDYYERADLLVIASRLEGAPMILWEAKAYGMPVVMFDLPYVTGTKETEGVVTVPMGDTFAMGEAIYACLTDQEKYERLSHYAVSALDGFDEKTILQRWRSVIDGLQKGVVPTELNPLCDRTRMLDISMEAVSSLARVLCDDKKGMEKRINAQIGVVRAECDNVWRKLNEAWQKHDAVCKERDEVWRKLDEAWKMHDVIRNERNEAWEKLDAALKRSGVPDDYIDLQRKLRDMQAEEVRHKMEIEALKARIAAAEHGAEIKDVFPARRFVWKNGDWMRGFTWPFRMAKSFCRSVTADGFSETKRRVVRKIVILFERFFPG
jgi:glycosyltransferase involved in cell wall biosynthesis